MGNPFKEYIQRKIYNRCYNNYRNEVKRQSERYAQFLRKRGEEPVIAPEVWKRDLQGEKFHLVETKESVVIYLDGGMPDKAAVPNCVIEAKHAEGGKRDFDSCIDREFQKKPWLLFLYGHEDFLEEDGRRHSPWFKPAWSPHTFETSFYIGSLFAVRKEIFQAWKEEQHGQNCASYTELGRELAAYCIKRTGAILSNEEQKPIDVMDAFLYHGFRTKEEADAWLPEESCRNADVRTDGQEEKAGISVIIPSKDNPQVLRICIESVLNRTKITSDFEIRDMIVIDNGSSENNRRTLEEMAKELSFRYHYEPMEFNFSKMCNIGASLAQGEYLLLLNDDMEVVQPDWLMRMFLAASREDAGAVGAKLLYPGTDLIQHAGVTNLAVGPAHKLLKAPDTKVYYHGRNRNRHDMLAVTAACLLVAKEKYEAVGGFCEEMAVAFNDVDFCFSLYEKGWYNIQCNDVMLYHHESLSRGDDNLSEEKWERLLREKHTLYTRHMELPGKDPFYSPLLAGHFSDYICNFEYEYEHRDFLTDFQEYKPEAIPDTWQNESLIVNIERAERMRRLEMEESGDVYWIEGWSYVLGMDNCQYRRCLLLTEEQSGRVYEAELLTRYREDVEKVLSEQKNVALAGFVCRIAGEKIQTGRYRIAMLAKDRTSRQRLYHETDSVLVVE